MTDFPGRFASSGDAPLDLAVPWGPPSPFPTTTISLGRRPPARRDGVRTRGSTFALRIEAIGGTPASALRLAALYRGVHLRLSVQRRISEGMSHDLPESKHWPHVYNADNLVWAWRWAAGAPTEQTGVSMRQ